MNSIKFIMILFTFMSTSSYGIESFYDSGMGVRLRYDYTPGASKYADRVFIAVEGDGDLCAGNENLYEVRLKSRWPQMVKTLSKVGGWIMPEHMVHYNCATKKERLDGLDLNHRIKELANLVAQIEKDYPRIKEIYVMAPSGGPVTAIPAATKLKMNKKFKGLIIANTFGRSFSDFFITFYYKQGLDAGDSIEKLNADAKKRVEGMKEVAKCDPKKKGMALLYTDFVTPVNLDDKKMIRTDNFYCQMLTFNLSKSLRTLPDHQSFMVIQSGKDRLFDYDHGLTIYKKLLEYNKDAVFEYYPEEGHSWATPTFLDLLTDSIEAWLD